MIKLNLLPPEEKSKIASRLALRQYLVWGTFSLVFVLIFLILISSIWWYLSIQLNSIGAISKEIEASPQTKALRELKKEIIAINKNLASFDKLEVATPHYSAPIEKLINLAPAGIRFKSISVSEKKIVLSGRAANREILLSFRDVLNGSGEFLNLDAPLSNFLKQNNIDFTFSFEIK